VVADRVLFNGNHYTMRPYTQNLLVYQTGTSQFTLNGNNFDMHGIFFTPDATTVINGNSALTVDGLFEGLNVTVNGNSFGMTGSGPPMQTAGGALIE
jgi:hypothetical protein